MLRPVCPLGESLALLFLDGVGWFPLNGRQSALENGVEPRMLMKNKQVSEESK